MKYDRRCANDESTKKPNENGKMMKSSRLNVTNNDNFSLDYQLTPKINEKSISAF